MRDRGYVFPLSGGSGGSGSVSIGGAVTGGTDKSVLYINPASTLAQITPGVDGQVLTMVSGTPTWASSSPYTDTFNATTDWGTASGGLYTITIPAATHLFGTDVYDVITYETIGPDNVQVRPDTTSIVSASGDVSLSVSELPDGRFAGKVVIIGAGVSGPSTGVAGKEGGTTVGTGFTILNFTGVGGPTLSDAGGGQLDIDFVNDPGVSVSDEGVDLGPFTVLNFVGGGVTATDGGGGTATITIPGGGTTLQYYAEPAAAPATAPTATGANAIAIGNSADASASSSYALGDNATASNIDCIAIGRSSTAASTRDISIGQDAQANTGSDNIAIGSSTDATGGNAIAIGDSAQATAAGAISIGASATNSTANTTQIGGTSNTKVKLTGDVELTDSTDAIYFGNETTDGTWRFVRSGNDLVVQRREAGVYVTKGTFVA